MNTKTSFCLLVLQFKLMQPRSNSPKFS